MYSVTYKLKKIKLKMMEKKLNNRQVITKMLREMSDGDICILRERIVTMSKEVVENKVDVLKSMENHFINGEWYVSVMETIYEKTKFTD